MYNNHVPHRYICGMVNNSFKSADPLYEYQKIVSLLEKKQNRSKKHRENISKIIRYLALNGPSTFWEISKNAFSSSIEINDKNIRRIIHGRKDEHKNKYGIQTKKFSPGLKQLEIIHNIKSKKKNYTLTSYGMLYAIKTNNFSSKDFAKIAQNNKDLFPLIFGKYDYLSKNRIHVSFLNRIANGIMLDLPAVYDASNPYHDMMTCLIAQNSYHGPNQFRSFVQLWFFIELMWFLDKERNGDLKKWLKIIRNDSDIYSECSNLFYQVSELVESRYRKLTEIYDSI